MAQRKTNDLTFEQIDDWFKIGGPPARQSFFIPRSVTSTNEPELGPSAGAAGLGRGLTRPNAYVPGLHSRPVGVPSKTEYAAKYIKEWERELLDEPDFDDDASEISCNTVSTRARTAYGLSDLESVSDLASLSLHPGEIEATAPPTDAYRNYNFDHTYDTSLPITKHREQIVNMVEFNRVTIIQGMTGSGKTTQVPQYILDQYVLENRHCNIVVTQPRKIAAISIARRVCQERQWQLGTLVGYQVGLERKTSEDTRLTFLTTGILLQKLINNRNMSEYTHIILDEVHERDQDTDFCMLVVRKLQRSNSRHVKVILMSATFDTGMFGEYFGVPVQGVLQPPPAVNIEGHLYDVMEHYADHLRFLGESPYPRVEDPYIGKETYQLARQLILHFDEIEQEEQGITDGSRSKNRGTVLVFLPGLQEIKTLDQLLIGESNTNRLWVLPLHSSITNQEQGQVFNKPQPGFRKVILATNIAESSITVTDIKYVIDFMLTKCMVQDMETNYQSLKLNWASKANAIQRKGRAGRVSSGRVYRLVTRHFYETFIQEYGVAEMLRCPLEQLILKVKILDLGEPKAILALALEPPNLGNIERTVLLLKEVGALTVERSGIMNPHDGDLTFVGRILATLPVDVRIGKLLVLGHVFGCLKECLVIGAGLSLKSFFSAPFRQQLEAYKSKMKWADGSFSDCIAILNAYMEWERCSQNGMFLRSRYSEKEWGRQNMIQINVVREVQYLIVELTKRLSEFNIPVPRGSNRSKTEADQVNDLLILKMVFAGAFYPNYFALDTTDEADALRNLSGRDPNTTVMIKNLPPYGYLYKLPIAKQLEKCGRGKKMYFEGQKGYIEFERPHVNDTQQYGTSILPAVYHAVKMRTLRINLDIDVYEVDSSVMKELENPQQGLLSEQKLKTSRVGVSVNDLGVLKQVDLPTPEQTWIDLKIIEVVDGNRFWANYVKEDTQPAMDQLLKDINSKGITNLKKLHGAPVAGDYVLAPYRDLFGEFYYRARVVKFIADKMPLVEVFFVDFGNTAVAPVNRLRLLEDHFKQLPFQAIECVLCGIKPSSKLPRNQWHPKVREWLTDSLINYEFTAKVYSVVNGVIHLDLYQCMYEGVDIEPPLHINQVMITKQFAEAAEEPYISKIDHMQREEEAVYPNLDPGWMNPPKSENARNPLANLRIKGKTRIHGPFSPYEVNFSSMTRVGKNKQSRVQQDSVNSVSLCTEPEEKYEKMMVAGNIGINNAGNVLLVRDATLMPNIMDLPALCCMMFAPTIELRRDKKKTRFIGALCGLGWDPETKQPALADHDIEVTFHSNITRKEISTINALRIGINLALASHDDVATVYGDVTSIQRQAREKILNILNTKREAVEPIDYRRAYQWNQIPEEEMIPNEIETLEDHDFPPLYRYHDAPALVERMETQKESVAGKLSHLEDLHSKASRSITPFEKPVMCYLCHSVFYCPRDLVNHLDCLRHRKEEEKLNFHLY